MEVFNAKDAMMAVFAHWETVLMLARQYSGLQSENVTNPTNSVTICLCYI